MATATWQYRGGVIAQAELQRLVQLGAVVRSKSDSVRVAITADTSVKEQLDNIAAKAGFVEESVDVGLFVNPAGDDNNGGLSAGDPIASIGEALLRIARGYTGTKLITLANGTYALGADPRLSIARAYGQGTDPPLFLGSTVDSGLGTRTATNASTAGSTSTFGTCVDAAGGLTVNAYRGFVLRFLATGPAGNQLRSFRVLSNTATTFTIAGLFPAAPTSASTFVVESPGAILAWTGTSCSLDAGGGTVGLVNVGFSGPGSSSLIRFTHGEFGLNSVDFTGVGSGGIQVAQFGALSNIRNLTSFAASQTVNTCGEYFASSAATLSVVSTGRLSLSNCVFNGTPSEVSQGGMYQTIDTGYAGVAWARAANCSQLAMTRVRFETVTGAAANSNLIGDTGAAVVVCKGSAATLTQVSISNTPNTNSPGDAVLVADRASADFSTVVGSGNAGVGLRVQRHSYVRYGNSPTVTGTGGDVVCGGNAAVAWAAAASNDLAAATPQLCLVTT